ncbi:MAG: hypothetical protein ACI9KD_001214, partial [Congregibacter sp.]
RLGSRQSKQHRVLSLISASLLFFGVLTYKAVWLIRKIQEDPPKHREGPW